MGRPHARQPPAHWNNSGYAWFLITQRLTAVGKIFFRHPFNSATQQRVAMKRQYRFWASNIIEIVTTKTKFVRTTCVPNIKLDLKRCS
jgi:hypothetical protein